MAHNPFQSPAEMRHPILFWIHKNLFSSALNTILTCIFICLIFLGIKDGILPLCGWDWSVIGANLTLILVGSYPAAEIWRIWLCLAYTAVFSGFSFRLARPSVPPGMHAIAAALIALALLPLEPLGRAGLVITALFLYGGFFAGALIKKRLAAVVIAGWILLLPAAFLIINGFGGPLPVVKSNYWGGLLLSLLVSLTCIFLSLPLGLFLALGRRSRLPLVKYICVVFIETIRGVPLITILFVGYLIFPMALPQGVSPSVFVRALAGTVMFHGAYMAEAFRGGFQGISRTQYEAAASMNLSPVKAMSFVILPQVLKRLIPILVNSFTSSLKDTSLISIIGMLDLIGISTSIMSNPKYLWGSAQVLLFEGMIYFVLCFSISRSSMSIEKKLGTGRGIGGNKR
jgi:general L-amino acid transport system permease protein